MINWLFFDLGSTLIDESDCEEFRLRELLNQPASPDREVVVNTMRNFAAQNLPAYKETAKLFGLKTTSWPVHLEKLYPETAEILARLRGKYKWGIIANQNFGTEKRLCQFGIWGYFDFIAASAELGIAKPDPGIFRYALMQTNCLPGEAVMIGDRLDNDIAPAGKLGMRTVWIRQGMGGNGNPSRLPVQPDAMVRNLWEIPEILEKVLDCEPAL